ncbi:MAG: 4Fe-4S dicluster domain-containing protein [Candidatus Aminicenantes bacterium]
MEKILPKKSLPKWVAKLIDYRIYTPVQKDDFWSYEVLEKPDGVSTDFPNTVLSPKKTIFPQREFLLEFGQEEDGTPTVKETLPEENETVFFGVRPCDAKGVSHMDKVFGGDFEDAYYWKRRNKTFLIGIACNTPPSPNCFCTSVNGSPYGTDGLDILLTDMGETYYVQTFTKKGEKLVSAAKALFKPPQPKDKSNAEKIHKDAVKKLPRQLKDTKQIPPKLKELFEAELWDEEAMSCIRCGICTYLCPTCHCFDINDEITHYSPVGGRRVRTWDNCQFPDFTMHSSGHNPRPDKASRLRQRIMHKFQYFVEHYNDYQCVGCGRCISKCPVGIDILEVLEKVRDYG